MSSFLVFLGACLFLWWVPFGVSLGSLTFWHWVLLVGVFVLFENLWPSPAMPPLPPRQTDYSHWANRGSDYVPQVIRDTRWTTEYDPAHGRYVCAPPKAKAPPALAVSGAAGAPWLVPQSLRVVTGRRALSSAAASAALVVSTAPGRPHTRHSLQRLRSQR